jgi:hypothetical protein
MLRLRTLLISSGPWLRENPVSSTADPENEPTKLFGLFNMAECEGRNWAPVDDPVESARSADRLYLSGAGRIGAAGASDDCDEVALFDGEGRGEVATLLVPGTGKPESSRVPTPVCRL